MTVLIKMTNWHQIEVLFENPEDVAKLKTFIDEGCIVVIGNDIESIMEEDALKIYGTIKTDS